MDALRSEIKGVLRGLSMAVTSNSQIASQTQEKLSRYLDGVLDRVDASTDKDLDSFTYDIEHVGDVVSEVSDPAPYYMMAYSLRERLQ